MNKQHKLLIVLGFVLAILILYIIFSSRVVTISTSQHSRRPISSVFNGREVEEVDQEKLTQSYQASARTALLELMAILAQAGIVTASGTELIAASETNETATTSEVDQVALQLAELKINLMDVLVPQQYKDLHFDMVLALSKFKEFIDDPDNQAALEEGLKLINQVKTEAPWLD